MPAAGEEPWPPLALQTPSEVIQCVFLRGKRPMSAPLPARGAPPRTAALTEPIEAELAPMCPGSDEDAAGDAAGAAGEPPAKRPRAAEEEECAAACEPDEACEAQGVEEFCRALREGPAWRSALGARPQLGKVSTMGDWLRSQGEDL
mmetsp:Transcript_103551/g.302207  ORF Transcript_103551/g.302207 Transcript_103551/m.302207 type:complete len:147 (+) Transcript_103551:66-506(+)